MSIAERIISERKRLDLSQANFARDAGVSLSSQKRYEKGEREPDTTYLTAISKAGVDVGYVLTGNRGDDKESQIRGYIHVVNLLQGYLGLGKGRLEMEFNEAVAASFEGTDLWWKNHEKNLDASERADDKLRAVFRKSPALGLTRGELEDLLDRVEFAQNAKGLKLSPRQKAQVILDLFAEEKEKGERSEFSRVEQVIERWGFL